MNQEQQAKVEEQIRKLEGLRTWAVAHNERDEAERLRQELAQLVEMV